MNQIENGKWGNPLLPDFSADITVHVCARQRAVSNRHATEVTLVAFICSNWWWVWEAAEVAQIQEPTHTLMLSFSWGDAPWLCMCVCGRGAETQPLWDHYPDIAIQVYCFVFLPDNNEKLSKLSWLTCFSLNNWNFIEFFDSFNKNGSKLLE